MMGVGAGGGEVLTLHVTCHKCYGHDVKSELGVVAKHSFESNSKVSQACLNCARVPTSGAISIGRCCCESKPATS